MSELDKYKDLYIDEDSVKWFSVMYQLHNDADEHPDLIRRLDEYAEDAPPSHIIKTFHYFRLDYLVWKEWRYDFQSPDQAYEVLKDFQFPPPYVPAETTKEFRWNWGNAIFDPFNNYLHTLGSDGYRALRGRLWEYAQSSGIVDSVVEFHANWK